MMTFIALITWWSCNAFIPVVSATLGQAAAAAAGLDKAATSALVESWKTIATTSFNFGGLLGTLLTVPIAKRFGRRPMFAIYFGVAALSLTGHLRPGHPGRNPAVHVLLHRAQRVRRLRQLYLLPTRTLPDAPARDRLGLLLQHRPRGGGDGPLRGRRRRGGRCGRPRVILNALFAVAFVPLVGLLFMPWVVETRGQELPP